MNISRANIHARPISVQERRRRALKGWETRRRNNPGLKNITKTGKDAYEWKRPNGEKVSLIGLSDQHVELLGPAFHAVDRHVKPDLKLNAEIRARKMRVNRATKLITGNTIGAETHFSSALPKKGAQELTDADKKVLKMLTGVEPHAWGNKDTVVLNTYQLKSNAHAAPAGLLTHEVGHLIGPGREEFFMNSSKKKLDEFGKAFQWQSRHPSKLDTWKATGNHPQATKVRRGTAKEVSGVYQATNPIEDAAETFRQLVGVPVDTRDIPSSQWDWKDTENRSREKYYKKHVLKQTAANNQYLDQTKSALQARRFSPVRSKLLKY